MSARESARSLTSCRCQRPGTEELVGNGHLPRNEGPWESEGSSASSWRRKEKKYEEGVVAPQGSLIITNKSGGPLLEKKSEGPLGRLRRGGRPGQRGDLPLRETTPVAGAMMGCQIAVSIRWRARQNFFVSEKKG